MSNRPWIALIAAAAISAGVGWYTYGRLEDMHAGVEVLDAVAEGFWLLFLILGASGVAVVTARYLRTIMRRSGCVNRSPTQLGQYTLESKLGEGAMGTVYRARHALLRRPTAVKLLLPERQRDPRALLRFEREVQQTSRLMHHNTVAVYDYGRDANGVFYYAMELIEGVTLETLVDTVGPLPPARVIYILVQVCGSLAEAHGIGLIHRDIKPANIMVCEQGGEHDVVKVVDFGLVKDTAEVSASLTTTQALAGTPLYASPEAIRGSDAVEARSDLYSLGAVGYFMLTGQRVFEGETVMEVCTKHLSEAPESPSSRTEQPVPEDLEAVVMACLAKEPGDRPADARAMRKALLACDDHSAWAEPEANRWWREHSDILPPPGSMPVEPDSEGKAIVTLSIDLGHRDETRG